MEWNSVDPQSAEGLVIRDYLSDLRPAGKSSMIAMRASTPGNWDKISEIVKEGIKSSEKIVGSAATSTRGALREAARIAGDQADKLARTSREVLRDGKRVAEGAATNLKNGAGRAGNAIKEGASRAGTIVKESGRKVGKVAGTAGKITGHGAAVITAVDKMSDLVTNYENGRSNRAKPDRHNEPLGTKALHCPLDAAAYELGRSVNGGQKKDYLSRTMKTTEVCIEGPKAKSSNGGDGKRSGPGQGVGKDSKGATQKSSVKEVTARSGGVEKGSRGQSAKSSSPKEGSAGGAAKEHVASKQTGNRESSGQERVSTERSGRERTGKENSGKERASKETGGRERAGKERGSTERSGRERAGKEKSGKERAGADRCRDTKQRDRSGTERGVREFIGKTC